jgi:hypothetical protein
MKKIKPLFKKIATWLVVLTMLSWTVGSFYVPSALAEGGINGMYLNDGGATPDTYITTAAEEAFLKIEIFDATGGTLNQVKVCLDETNSFDASTDLEFLKLYRDANSNGTFDSATDTLLGSITTFTTLTDTFMAGGSCQLATFSSLAQTIPTTWATSMKLFVTTRAKANVDATPMRNFSAAIPTAGIDVTTNVGAVIADWPSGSPFKFPPVWLGTEGSGGGGGGFGNPILISEVKVGEAGDANLEFVELYNRTPDAIDISGMKLHIRDADGVDAAKTLTLTQTCDASGIHVGTGALPCNRIPGNGFFLIAPAGSPLTEDATYEASGNMLVPNGSVYISNSVIANTGVTDMVGWGSQALGGYETQAAYALVNDAKSLERKAFPASTPAMLASGGTHATKGNSEDTNNNSMDLILQATAVPQNTNSATESSSGGYTAGDTTILINEVLYNTATATAWIELYNRSGSSQDIAGWKLISNAKTYTVPAGTSIAASGFKVVYWNQAGADTTAVVYTSNSDGTTVNADLATNGGDIILRSNTDAIKDYVQYGGSGFANEAAAAAAAQWPTGTFVPNCLYGQTIGRRSTTGEDFNTIGDWQTYTAATIGFANMGGDSTAPTAVTAVTLVDNDNTANSSINGRDITITFTPSTTPDPSFDRYELYILPATVVFDSAVHRSVDRIFGGQYQYVAGVQQANFTFTGTASITNDSVGTGLATGSYRAYVVAVDRAGNQSSTAMSAAATLTSEAYAAGSDTTDPFIMHMGVFQAKENTDIALLARFVDDRALDGTHPAQVIYRVNAGAWAAAVDCVATVSNYYTCTIPGDALNTVDGDTVSYILKATDAATTPNIKFFSSSPVADNGTYADNAAYETAVKATPFTINILAANDDTLGDYTDADASVDLSGVAKKSDGSFFPDDEQPKLFLEGTGNGIVTPANGTGAFSFADNTLTPGSYNLIAIKDGYMDMMMSAFKGSSGLIVFMNQGNMNFTGGAAGGGNKPMITWTAPGDNMMGAPRDIYCTGTCTSIGANEQPIIIGFSQEMNANTINDEDTSNAGSNIYLTTNGQNRVAGKVYYNTATREARFYTTTHDALIAGTYYTIVVTQSVTNTAGNSIMGGIMPDGSFASGFTTMMDNSSLFTGGNYSGYGGGGMAMPPYVAGTIPQAGSFGMPINRSIVVQFSDPMDSSSINTNTIKLYPVTSESPWTVGTTPVTATVTLDQSTQKFAIIDPASSLPANASNHGWYVLRVMSNVKSVTGVWLGNPSSCQTAPDVCLASQTGFEARFQVDTNSTTYTDATAPTILGTYPNNNDGITVGTTPVNVGIPSIDIGFSEPINPSTITTQNITLQIGATAVGGKVRYDAIGNTAKFIPTNALSANTQYILTIGTGVTDLAGVALATASTVTFKTGGADTTAPTVLYANGDDYTVAVTYSEPMIAAKQTDTNNWSKSAINPANYFIKTLTSGGVGTAPYSSITALSTLTTLSLTYDEATNTVTIKGFSMFSSTPHPADFQIFVDTVADKSNNTISASGGRVIGGANAAQGPIQSSTETYGQLGPGSGGGMMGTGGSAGPGPNMSEMGMKMAGAFPMNAMAGKTSKYFINIPTSQIIPSGGSIKLTFPAGFDVTNAIEDPNSPNNNDINGPGTGTVTIASVTPSAATRTIAIVTATAATMASDFLNLDISGIVNSSIPKDFGTDGYTVDIKTFNASGAMLETITTMPFYITQAGSYTLDGTITFRNGGNTANINCDNNETLTLYLGSPMTGPQQTTVTCDGDQTATYSFTGLPASDFYMFTDPTITVKVATVDTDFNGLTMPDQIHLTGNTTKNFSLFREDATSGTAVIIDLVGNFSTGGVADNVDIFANSPRGFKVKTLSSVGVKAAGGADATLYLPDGDWMIGIGPAVPRGPMGGPPPMPDWMPPMSIPVKVTSPTVAEQSGTANDGIVVFNISTQLTKTVTGTVTDGTNGIADAEVYAYQPNGGFGGSHTKTATNGTFTLKIPVLGTYKIGAFKPGLPNSPEISLNVQDNVTGVTIQLRLPAYTISGKVLNNNSQPIAYAPVWAYTTTGTSSGNANGMTDATGNYILYVDNGTWRVEADAPGFGRLQYDLPVTIAGASQSNINLKPATDLVWKIISGTVTIDGSTQNYMPIRAVAYNASGDNLGQEYRSSTNSSGQYTISVPGTSSADSYRYYRVDMWTQLYGEVQPNVDGVADSPANVRVNNSNSSSVDITIAGGSLNTATIAFDNKADYVAKEAFINIDGVSFSGTVPTPTGFHLSLKVSDISGADPTVRLRSGDYFMMVDVPGYGNYMPKATSDAFDAVKRCITIDGTSDNIAIGLPDLDSAAAVITISGTVSGPSAGQRDAWVWIGNPETGFHTGMQANATTGVYSMTVPILTSGNYFVGADKAGYVSGSPTSDPGTANATINFTLTAQDRTISGVLYIDGDSDYAYDIGEILVTNGWVRAEEITTGAQSFGPSDGTGAYSLGVTTGTWKVFGMGNGYAETQYKNTNGLPATITVSASQTANIALVADAGWTNRTVSASVTPSSGATIDDTEQDADTGLTDGTGVKMVIPPNALGSDNAAGNVNAENTANVSPTDSFRPFNNEGTDITATDNSGQPITNLDNDMNLEMVLYRADILAADEMIDLTKLKTMQVSYWNETASEWVSLPTTRKAFHKVTADTDWTLYNGTATQSGFDKFIDDALGATPTFIYGTHYDDYKLVFTATTDHLTVFALGVSPDGVAPSAPTSPTQASGSGTSVGLSWTAPTTNADLTALTDLYGYAVYRSTNNVTYSQVNASAILAPTVTYTDSTTTAWTSYYYKITAGDDDDIESAYSTVLQVCSNKTVSNGTVAASCAITCNAGYSVSGNSCASLGGGGGGGSTVTTPTITQVYDPVTGRTLEGEEAEEYLEGQEAGETGEETVAEKAEQPAAESPATGAAQSFAAKIVQITDEAAEVIKANIESLLSKFGFAKSETSENLAETKYLPILAKGVETLSVSSENALTNFVAYGTNTTIKLGAGERAGVVNSYKSAFGKLPNTETEWSDVIKIANGRWPSERDQETEGNATQAFKKIYLRAPNRANQHDDAAVTVIAYGLRPADRNLNSEKAAIRTFRAIYGYAPKSAVAWDIVRAIAYSGAKR